MNKLENKQEEETEYSSHDLKTMSDICETITGLNRHLCNIMIDYCLDFNSFMCNDQTLLERYFKTINMDTESLIWSSTKRYSIYKNGNFLVVTWLLDKYLSNKDDIGYNCVLCPLNKKDIKNMLILDAFITLCKYGHLELVQFIYNDGYMRPCNNDDHDCMEEFEKIIIDNIFEPITKYDEYNKLDKDKWDVLVWLRDTFSYNDLLYIKMHNYKYDKNEDYED